MSIYSKKHTESTPFTYYLYHIPTGKKYYGVRFSKNCSPDDLWTTYFSSSKKVKSLIKQYGKSSFIAKVRKVFDNHQDAINWENRVLLKLKVLQKEDWLNDNIAGAIAPQIGENNPFFGKTHSTETKKKISETRKKSIGKYCWVHTNEKETRILIVQLEAYIQSGWTKGRTKSMCEKISNFAKTRIGEKNSFYGKTHIDGWRKDFRHTNESKRKMSEAHKGKKMSDETKEKMRKSHKKRFSHK